MSLIDRTAPLSEVAAALGKSEDWLRRNWLRFHREQGFPRKLAGWVWPRRAVEIWIEAEGRAAEALPLASNDNGSWEADALVAAQREAMAQRYGVQA